MPSGVRQRHPALLAGLGEHVLDFLLRMARNGNQFWHGGTVLTGVRRPTKCSAAGSGAKGNRTLDLFHAMEALCQLSYSPVREITVAAPTW